MHEQHFLISIAAGLTAIIIQIFAGTAMTFTHLDHHAISLGCRPKTELWQPCKYKSQKPAMHNILEFGSLTASDMTKHVCNSNIAPFLG